ncbi:MAG: hypothetical protein FJ404_12455 [Verrucomicrobia bacterium]|nr:hypothetical protein [Verrucomicrobiota bacterium]
MFGRRTEPSPTRRIVRGLIWAAFAAVLVLRYGVFREYYAEYHRERAEEGRREGGVMAQAWTGGGGGNWRQGRRRGERTPARVRAAQQPVPADFPRFEIQIAPKDVETLRGYHWSGWGGQEVERPAVMATVKESGVLYTNVEIKLKGAAGSFRPFDDKPAWTLNFSKHAPHQQFKGFSKFSLNNSVQDDSFLCEIITREMFVEAGVPAPQAGHATAVVNGRDLGLYVMVEGYGKPFLKRHFRDTRGNLYDSGFCRDIDAPLDTNSGDHPEDRSDLEQLLRAALEPQAKARETKLKQILDLDRFMTMLALESITCHWDGYSMNRNNYRVFHDLQVDKLIFLPHGLDQMFGIRRSSPHMELLPPMRGVVSDAVLSLPGAEEVFLKRVASLTTQVFVAEKLTRRVQGLAAKLRPTLAAYGPDFVSQHQAACDYLVQRIETRAKSVSMQLAFFQEAVAKK